MSRKILIILALTVFVFPTFLFSQIYHIDISGEIDLGLPPYIERVIKDAEAVNARAVLLEVNTFGGRVDAATQIKDMLFNTDLETIAFINKRAISAGAFISLSCKKIGMVPGSTMGAAEVVVGQGEKASEKAISYFRSEMGATAERNGRNREIAEGMVDSDVEIEGIIEKDKLITLTAEDALKWEMADYIAPTLDAFLDTLGLQDEEIVYSEENWAETTVRFLTGSVISALLMSLGMLGIFFELQSPGWGVAGTIGLLCLVLFFGSHYIINLASAIEIVLFLLGIILLAVEIFVLPGFGVAGVSGIICIVAGLYLSLLGNLDTISMPDMTGAALRVGGALLITIAGAVILGKFVPRTGFWKKLSLSDEQKSDEGYVASKDFSSYVGKTGIALTPLRPAGVGEFGNERLDIVSEGDFIEKKSTIKIIRIEGYRLVVREIRES